MTLRKERGRQKKRGVKRGSARAGGAALVHPQVDEDVVAQVVSDWTGIPMGNMLRDEAETLLALEDRLEGPIRGQREALTEVADVIRAAKAGLGKPEAPLGVFLLVGPSGVGKTETALQLADLLFGGARFLTTINMSEYQESHTTSQLKGSPPGYVGYGEGGVLTEAVRQRPYSVVPYYPLGRPVLEDITRLKLGRLAGRLDAAHKAVLHYTPAAVQRIAERCAHSDMGARNIDAVIDRDVLPAASRELLARLSAEQGRAGSEAALPERLTLDVADGPGFAVSFDSDAVAENAANASEEESAHTPLRSL